MPNDNRPYQVKLLFYSKASEVTDETIWCPTVIE
jgi:hypothetical protein